MRTDTHLGQLFFRNSNARFINRCIQISLTAKSGGRGRGPNEVEYRRITVQGMTGPVPADQVEHAMLHQVPFGGSGWIMVNGDNQTELVSQTLQAHLPELAPTAIGPTAIGLDQHMLFVRIKPLSQFQPPGADCRDCKLSGIVRGPYQHIALIVANVINAIGDRFPLGQTQKIVNIDLAPLLSPLGPGLGC